VTTLTLLTGGFIRVVGVVDAGLGAPFANATASGEFRRAPPKVPPFSAGA